MVSPANPIAEHTSVLQRAEQFLAQGSFAEAIPLFQSLLKTAYGFEGLMGLGVISASLGQMAEAALFLEQAVLHRPKEAQAHYNLGIALKSLGRGEESVQHLKIARGLDESNASICSMLGNAMAALGQNQDAIESYNQALALDPDYGPTWYNLGVLHQSIGHKAKAAVCYEKAVASHPNFAEAWTNLGTIRQGQGMDADAVRCFQQAIKIRPDFGDAKVDLGLSFIRLGQKDEALVQALAADLLPPGIDFPHYSLGLLFAKLNRVELAQKHLILALNQDPSDSQGAGLILAALGLKPLPARSSDAQMTKLYETRAATWDQGVSGQAGYRGHLMVADLFDHLIPDAANVAVLDAGCGTGLVGERVALRKPKSLDGVDLSQTMLSRAQERAVYDSLECCELVSYMERMPEHYDVIVSAATLIHFGDLAPVFRAASVCLRPGGRMLFTVFSNEGADVTLSFENGHAEGGCYLHSRHHVETAAFEAGLTVEYREEGIHEYDRGKPVMAVCVGLLRQ